jgi:Kef-type K+ transport system membrane component KefB
VLFDLLTALAAVILLAQGLGRVSAWLQQPPVIGEIVAGLILGPSVLGLFAPDVQRLLIGPGALPSLAVVAQLGGVLYMFLVGLDVDSGAVRRQLRATVTLASASILVPLLGGALLGIALYPHFAPSTVARGSFVLFFGVAMSVTAFPVLARILEDRKLMRTPLGVLALSSAAVADVSAWCLLALVIGMARTPDAGIAVVVLSTTSFMTVTLFLVRPAVRLLVHRVDRRHSAVGSIAFGLLAMLLAAVASDAAGIHAIFGAFLMGAIIPRDSGVARRLRETKRFVTVLFLPAYFAFAGLRTDVGLVSGWNDWMTGAAIVFVATAGKFAGAFIAGPSAHLGLRDAAAFGALMNARGLVELIVLNVGLDAGVITPRLYTLLVLMAVVTTISTSPLLRLLLGPPPDAAPRGHTATSGRLAGAPASARAITE